MTPRLTARKNGEIYSSDNFLSPEFTVLESDGNVTVKAVTGLCNLSFKRLEGDTERIFIYTLTCEGMKIRIENADNTAFVLPIISGKVNVLCGSIAGTDDIFFLTGGFEACEYTIYPDESGVIEVVVE